MANWLSGPASGGAPGGTALRGGRARADLALPSTLDRPARSDLEAPPLLSPPAGPAPRRAAGGSGDDGGRAWPRTLTIGARADTLLLLGLVCLSLALRWRTLWTSYWGDEAIAIGIAAHPLGSLPHYLVNDGSPPLYYVALHFWMQLFGRSEPATHALSLVPGLAAIPAAWWCGTRLFGRGAGRIAAALTATCAYLDYYSTETRMYAWLVLAAMLALTFFVLAFRGGGRVYWAGATVFMSIVLYLQYYGLYLLAATTAAGLALAWYHRSWASAKATAAFAVVCSAIFAPWAPQFLYQLHHTGAPWAPHPGVLDLFGDSFNTLASAGWAAIVFAIIIAVLGQPRRGGRSAYRAQPTWALTLALSLAIPVLTLALAWAGGQVVNSWNPRYLGIAVVPALLALAGGLSRARYGRLGAVVAFVSLTATALPMVLDRGVTVLTAKSDAAYLMQELGPQLRPGALIISSEVTDAPVFALDLGKHYRYATPLGLLKDPLVVNWSNLPTRLQTTVAAANLAPLIAAEPRGGQVVIINPTSWGGGETPEKYAAAVEAEAIAADDYVVTDPHLVEVKAEGVPRYSNPLYPMEATLFVKR